MLEPATPATQPRSITDEVIEAGNLLLNLGNYRLQVDGRPVDLTYHEFDLLRLLAERLDHVVGFRDLARALWQADGHREVRRLNVLAFRLRAKLTDSWPYRIETIRGRGYGLVKAIEGASRG